MRYGDSKAERPLVSDRSDGDRAPGPAPPAPAGPVARRQDNFLLHIRPKSYPADAVAITNTFYLGFLSVFFLVFEIVTGIVLMVYYVPSPEQAYYSILRLMTEVPFGWLLRDLHRLGGECMIVVVLLHLVRVFCTGSYRGRYGRTWMTGVALLACTLALSFSGYLLPWDQLSFWAVTIGTSMADPIPWIGPQITVALRGGPELGQDGLLRFYLLHIIALPLFLALCAAIHYYRISRVHGISRPIAADHRPVREGARIPLYPRIILEEATLSLFLLTGLIVLAAFCYDAPLELPADPHHTPVNTQAPWFFRWIQGALKLGDSLLLGVCLPACSLLALSLLPLIDRSPRRPLRSRPAALGVLLTIAGGLVGLTLLGEPDYGVNVGPVARVLEKYAPENGPSRFHDIGYSAITPGIYVTGAASPPGAEGAFGSLLRELSRDIDMLAGRQGLADPTGILLVEEWQVDLKRITLRVRTVNEAAARKSTSYEATVFLHRDRLAGTGRQDGRGGS